MFFFGRKKDMRCAVCTAEFRADELKLAGVKACPNCGSTMAPLKVSQDGYIKINWQDLRTLAIYAKRWSGVFPTNSKGNRDALLALQVILKALEKYRPKDAMPLVPIDDVVVVTPIGRNQKIQLPPIAMEGRMEDQFDGDAPLVWEKDSMGRIKSPFFRKL